MLNCRRNVTFSKKTKTISRQSKNKGYKEKRKANKLSNDNKEQQSF